MTETQWRRCVSNLRKGYTVRIDEDTRIVPFVMSYGTTYSLRCGCNVVISTCDLDRIKEIVI